MAKKRFYSDRPESGRPNKNLGQMAGEEKSHLLKETKKSGMGLPEEFRTFEFPRQESLGGYAEDSPESMDSAFDFTVSKIRGNRAKNKMY